MGRRAYPSRRSTRGIYRQPWTGWAIRRRVPFGRFTVSGAGTITGVVTLTGIGVKKAVGSGTISAVGLLSGAGIKGGIGAGTITGTVQLSGTGSKASGIGSVPRPRVRWQFVLGPAGGGHELALTDARSRRFTVKLTDPSEIAFSLDGRHPQTAAVEELLTDAHVLWTSSANTTEILFRGRVGATGDTGDDAKHAVEVNALDYRALLKRRILYSGDTLTYAATDQAEIAYGLIFSTQGNLAGDLGIAKGWTGVTPTGINRDRTYEAGDSVGERIQELSEVIDGFDWDITPVSASGLRLDVFYPQRGLDRGVVLEAGGLVKAWRREVNPADYANALRYTGAAGDDVTPGPTPQELAAGDLATRAEGRWDATFGDDGLINQSTLNDRAAWQLTQSQVIRPTYSLTLVEDAWDGPGHMWLGDTVRVVIMSGRLAVDVSLRIYEMAFTLGEDGQESLEITVGGPKPDFRRRATLTEQRLKNLERR